MKKNIVKLLIFLKYGIIFRISTDGPLVKPFQKGSRRWPSVRRKNERYT